jgi:hypothetical protein
MKASSNGRNFLKEFREFIKFLQSLWGILAGLSVLFPLSNVFAKVIPFGVFGYGGEFVLFTPALVTSIATLTSLFLILWTFGQRHTFQDPAQRPFIQRQAGVSFGIGLFALVVYIAGYFAMQRGLYGPYEGSLSYYLEQLAGDVLLLTSYCGFFAFMTRAFELLAMMEYFA